MSPKINSFKVIMYSHWVRRGIIEVCLKKTDYVIRTARGGGGGGGKIPKEKNYFASKLSPYPPDEPIRLSYQILEPLIIYPKYRLPVKGFWKKFLFFRIYYEYRFMPGISGKPENRRFQWRSGAFDKSPRALYN
jgi:hypothetical protein